MLSLKSTTGTCGVFESAITFVAQSDLADQCQDHGDTGRQFCKKNPLVCYAIRQTPLL